MKNLGSTDMISGMKISKTPNGISLSLAHCIERMLYKFDFNYTKSISIPYDFSISLRKNTGQPMFQLKFSQLIGLVHFYTYTI